MGTILSDYLTIIPQARMGSESIAHEAEGQLTSWSKIWRQNNFSWLKLDFNPFLPLKSWHFSLLVGC